MAEINKELLEKAKQANSPEDLLALAKENDVEFTREQAEAYFEQMNKSGELSDDELDNVAGGTCYKGDRPITTIGNYCEFWNCKYCGGNDYDARDNSSFLYMFCGQRGRNSEPEHGSSFEGSGLL